MAAPGGNTAGSAVSDDGLNGAYQLFSAGERDPTALELKYAAVAEFAAVPSRPTALTHGTRLSDGPTIQCLEE